MPNHFRQVQIFRRFSILIKCVSADLIEEVTDVLLSWNSSRNPDNILLSFLEKVSANRFRCLKDTNRFITHMHSTSEEMKNTESDISSGI